MRPDDAETTDELDVAVVGVVGARLDALTAAVTIAAPHREADEVVSQLATLTHAGPVRWDARATWREWIVGLTADPTGAVFAVTADGALRIVGDGRRYPLPVRAGLAAVTAIGPEGGASVIVVSPHRQPAAPSATTTTNLVLMAGEPNQ